MIHVCSFDCLLLAILSACHSYSAAAFGRPSLADSLRCSGDLVALVYITFMEKYGLCWRPSGTIERCTC